ncbi:hypothetical protein [Nonomuraea wenchangensis]|uniref:Uncharacterized protein n=1 Tax=Nonomuraea wenchangensis TaxID=568860 RepID=A0A1I0EFX5_9ACTN|nr:hypothetical protein [Nonomuraea wenchangensis]SET43461.1 hypothetical protein SAMN05421811_10312 [Nonomuraea wenchangensis]
MEFTMTDCTAYVGGYDFTTDVNKMSLKAEVEDKENTTFGNGGWKSRVGGLRDITLDMDGYWQSATADAVDPVAFNNLGQANRVVTVSQTGQAGSTAYFFEGGSFNYELFGSVGDVTPFTIGHKGTSKSGLVRGKLAKAKGLVSATGVAGSPVELGAVADGQYLYAVVHVFSPGTTVTLKIESDAASSFASATDVAALPAIITAGGTWVTRIAGPITDTYFRFNATAITGSFTLAAAIGIGS